MKFFVCLFINFISVSVILSTLFFWSFFLCWWGKDAAKATALRRNVVYSAGWLDGWMNGWTDEWMNGCDADEQGAGAGARRSSDHCPRFLKCLILSLVSVLSSFTDGGRRGDKGGGFALQT